MCAIIILIRQMIFRSFKVFLEAYRSPYRHRELLLQLVIRDVHGRYKGSFGGTYWAVLQPIMMLAVYTTVFGVFMKSRWQGTSNSIEFSVVLFVGLLVFGLFSECITRAPSIVLNNPNYVKKVPFPLEIYPFVILGAALFHLLLGFMAWVVFAFFVMGKISITALMFPLVLLPMMPLMLGLMWILSAIGVYVRDVGQIVSVLVQVSLFLSPVFYPVSSLSPRVQQLLQFNPLTIIVEASRSVLVQGSFPDFSALGVYFLGGTVFSFLGYAFFAKLRSGFADVI